MKEAVVYIVYPLIEECLMDYKDLIRLLSIARRFPKLHLSICHGKMKSVNKDYEMRHLLRRNQRLPLRYRSSVNVPNASIMVIESAERSLHNYINSEDESDAE